MKRGGFTLVEVLAAVSILGMALFILLDAHYTALRLNVSVRDAVVSRQLLETTVQQAEVAVLNGEFSGSDDFGQRYPEYSWSWDAQRLGDEGIELYQVNVTVNGPPDGDEPAEPQSLTFYTYAITPPDEEGIFSGTQTGRSGS